jgi:class 3 adenylate cyclase
LWEQHPDAMRPALARHDAIVRDAIEGNDGFVVKTTGDGFHAAFADPGDAVVAAVAGNLRCASRIGRQPARLTISSAERQEEPAP